MLRFISILALVVHSGAFAITPVDKFFNKLAVQTGDYHQATIMIAESPKEEPTDLEKHDFNSQLWVRKLSDKKYSLQSFTKTEGEENSANATVIEREDQKVTLTYFDLNDSAKSYRVVNPSTGANDGVELSYYQSAVEYLDNSEAAIAKRKTAQAKRAVDLGALVIVMALLGKNIPAEVIKSEDYLNALVVDKDTIVNTEILLDPEGKSARNPNGQPSLTVFQVFHKGH